MLGGSGVLTVRTNCDSSDDFASVWRKALSEISVDRTAQGVGFGSSVKSSSMSGAALPGGDPVTPPAVPRALGAVSSETKLAVVVDEFDRLGGTGGKGRALF